jgi:hypothetical protein
MHKRKTSPYLPRNELHSAFNRKISAYFTFTSYLIERKTSYLKARVLSQKSKRTSFLMHYGEPNHK